jgi:hypothetical protein
MTIIFGQMDQKWMYVSNQVNQQFFDRLETFLEVTAKYKKPKDMFVGHYICCMCVNCYNEKKTSDIEKIHEHLMVRGFMSIYIYISISIYIYMLDEAR